MSLITDKFFYDAIAASETIDGLVDGRIFNPARATADEDEDLVPYIIITFDGMVNDNMTKDEIEGDTDEVQVSVLCCATDRESLATLIAAVRTQIVAYYDGIQDGSITYGDEEIVPLSWTLKASSVGYDETKPCCFQTLTYDCTTNNV